MLKVLNLYSCLGGNRYKWSDCEVTAVELDTELARLYQERFPNDKVIVADAHQYLLDHYKEFDFIWSSPPCPTHSRINTFAKNSKYYKARYPDMTLYQEIILLQHYFKGKYVVENVIPYYEPLIEGQKRGRHIYWTNFKLPLNLNVRTEFNNNILIKREQKIKGKDNLKYLCELHEIDLSTYKGKQNKKKIANNLVDYEVGNAIFEIAKGNFKINNDIKLFED